MLEDIDSSILMTQANYYQGAKSFQKVFAPIRLYTPN